MAQLPVLPHGSPSLLSSLAETFSFHASPESFITSRVLAFRSRHPDLAESRTPIRAKILNRNVAVISSYEHIKQLLCDGDTLSKLSSARAYDELMTAFFHPPNLLLTDPPAHRSMKEAWKSNVADMPNQVHQIIGRLIHSHFSSFQSGTSVDLYENTKELSWKIILGVFLCDSYDPSKEGSPETTREVIRLQEDLLRGQFSLFPVSINTGLWQSPRSKGIKASRALQNLLRQHLAESRDCPMASSAEAESSEPVVNHLLLFTSSLAVKALASLLTAVLLNLYIYHPTNTTENDSLAKQLRHEPNPEAYFELMSSVIRETERLSPPVVGIMRRTISDIVLLSGSNEVPSTLVPKNWDAWLYFVGASRDPATFGSTADVFLPERYLNSKSNIPDGLAFGAGPKTCLGKDLMRSVVKSVADWCIGSPEGQTGIEVVLEQHDVPTGVKGWLGWEADVKPEDWARGMKQLPTQRPVKPVMVELRHNFPRD